MSKPKTPNQYLKSVFAAKQIPKHGVVRRAKSEILRVMTLEAFVKEVMARGYHMLESGGQCIVLCNEGYFQIHC